MRIAKVRLALALVAFLAWLAFIAYQTVPYYRATALGKFPVVSHAQLLVSSLVIIADVKADPGGLPVATVHVVEVPWPAGKKDLAGKDISIANLPVANGFRGEGRYIVPLVSGRKETYLVAGLPRSPGFERSEFLIYPDTPLTRDELARAPKPPAAE